MIEQNSDGCQSEVFILDESCSDFLKELAAYNGPDNFGDEIFIDIDDKRENKVITIDDYWFLGV